MDRAKALTAAAALTLTVAGGVSALFLTVGLGAGSPDPEPSTAAETTIVTEYVDQYGNPVPAPTGEPVAVVAEAAPLADTAAQVPATMPPNPDEDEDDEDGDDD